MEGEKYTLGGQIQIDELRKWLVFLSTDIARIRNQALEASDPEATVLIPAGTQTGLGGHLPGYWVQANVDMRFPARSLEVTAGLRLLGEYPNALSRVVIPGPENLFSHALYVPNQSIIIERSHVPSEVLRSSE